MLANEYFIASAYLLNQSWNTMWWCPWPSFLQACFAARAVVKKSPLSLLKITLVCFEGHLTPIGRVPFAWWLVTTFIMPECPSVLLAKLNKRVNPAVPFGVPRRCETVLYLWVHPKEFLQQYHDCWSFQFVWRLWICQFCESKGSCSVSGSWLSATWTSWHSNKDNSSKIPQDKIFTR